MSLIIFICSQIFIAKISFAQAITDNWHSLQPIIDSRVAQTNKKMKLYPQDVEDIKAILSTLDDAPNLSSMQRVLPKTTLELIRAIAQRNLDFNEAESMAGYMDAIVQKFNFENIQSFDENTSHIIGREWSEIDYSGENMTWQNQKEKYAYHDIQHFKSQEMLKKFFSVESKLPYFKKIYKPRSIITNNK